MQRTMAVRRGVVLALVLALFPVLPWPASAEAGTTYYVDAAAGSDDEAGHSPGTAWRSLDKVNATTFNPGDRVLLRAGRSWQGAAVAEGFRKFREARRAGPVRPGRQAGGAFEHRQRT